MRKIFMACYSRYSGTVRRVLTPVNTAVIVVNVIIFIWMSLIGDTNDINFMYRHGADAWFAVFEKHEYYRLLTAAFIHFGFAHLFNNMLVLAFIGDNLERALGPVRYVVLYLCSAVGANLASDVWCMYRQELIISGGASGAIFGVVGAMLVILIRNHGRLEDLSTTQVALFAAFSIYHGISSSGVDNAAHVGGFIVGAGLGLILYRRKDTRTRRGRHNWR